MSQLSLLIALWSFIKQLFPELLFKTLLWCKLSEKSHHKSSSRLNTVFHKFSYLQSFVWNRTQYSLAISFKCVNIFQEFINLDTYYYRSPFKRNFVSLKSATYLKSNLFANAVDYPVETWIWLSSVCWAECIKNYEKQCRRPSFISAQQNKCAVCTTQIQAPGKSFECA